ERPDASLPACGRGAATLELAGAHAEPVAPSDDYADAANGVFRALNPARRSGRARLRGAKTPAGQAQTAAGLAAAFDRARHDLSEVSPPVATSRAHGLIIAGLD